MASETSGGADQTVSPAGRVARSVLLAGLAVLVCMWVYFANGGVLFYFDTENYIGSGLELLGLGADTAAGGTGGEGQGRATADGSRSLVFAVLAALAAEVTGIVGLAWLHALGTVVLVWIAARACLRSAGLASDPAMLALVAITVASLGSLSFYVTSMMPDVMAAWLILVAAVLIGFAGRLGLWETLLLLAFGALATLAHLSHLAIASLLVPVAVVLALVPGHRRWLAPLALVGFVALGYGTQLTMQIGAQVVRNAEVTYRPFITARLIQDGPGLDYLHDTCPDAEVPTCALAEALKLSDDPWRLTATHILFERSDRLGSFLRMTPEDQRLVANDQRAFFLEVLADRPIATMAAFALNTWRQAAKNSVVMTLQDDEIVEGAVVLPDDVRDDLHHGRLTRTTDWLDSVHPAQQALYGVSALAIVVMLVWPGGIDRRTRVFLLAIGVGLLLNALICGGVSQPAARYGARVIWLLPLGAVLGGAVWIGRRRDRRRAATGGAA